MARDQHGCDMALRPRGKAAHGPREAQVAREWRRHVARGHASPREYPRGRHVARGVGIWRAHGLVGHGNRIGALTQ